MGPPLGGASLAVRDRLVTRAHVISTLTAELRKSFSSVTEAMVTEIIDAWLAGDRGMQLPHGLIGMIAGHELDEVERQQPGMLKGLR